MKRDIYADVSARIVAELEAGAAPWVKPWSATPGANTPCNAVSNRPYSGCNVVLLWMAQAAGYRSPRFLTFKQALELGGNVRKGEHGTKVFFVKQLQVRDSDADGETATRLVPMLREYTVFNVDQCENLPDSIKTGKPMRVRNPDTRDELADAFLQSTGADIREGNGEAYFVPSRDFISLPAFAGFKGADHFYNVAFHELTHNAEPSVMPRRSGFARKRDQTDVAMRHNQSDSRKLSRASSGLYRPGRDVVDATRARAFSLRRMSACM
jgi:antirestriction protein ArdC